MQIANCCKGGVVSSWIQDPANAVASFQISVGQSGTTNTTVRAPKNVTLMAPGPGYTCGAAKKVPSSKFVSQDGRRITQSLCMSLECFTLFICLLINFYFPCQKIKEPITIYHTLCGSHCHC